MTSSVEKGLSSLNIESEEDSGSDYDYYQDNFFYDSKERSGVTKSGNLRKLEAKINVSQYMPLLGTKAANELHRATTHTETGFIKMKDKQDRATQEQVLDPRTRVILLKMINRGLIESVNGCVSTGKEANVYHAATKTGEDRAIKVYKTSILTFKDRDKYMSGEFRFRHGYCRHNPRKMVRTWAEKEMRNLVRLQAAGISSPQPFLLRSHVLLMDFIGTQGIPAPLVKEVPLTESKARQLYLECIIIIRKLYRHAKLVHADLSEFNLLYHQNSIVTIDVSQAVEHDHPRAVDFLRKDCANINHFFRKNGVVTLTLKELFDFVTDPNLEDEDVDRYLEKAQEIAASRSLQDLEELEKTEEGVFLNSYLPQKLEDVIDYELDYKRAAEGQELIYGTITSLKADLSGAATKPSLLEHETQEENGECSSEWSDSEEADNGEKESRVTAGRPRDENPEDKKARKKAVKEAQREKRKDKMPKHVKKRLTKGPK